ncbi:MAG: class I SAM-dependent methyltransferase [Pirellulales bacterium]
MTETIDSSFEYFARNREVLNLFSFSGGFSVAAGVGEAAKVTSVDIAAPAIEAAKIHWQLNELPDKHEAVVADCFQFLEDAIKNAKQWDMVICDPPSFAPSQQTQANAIGAYTRLSQLSAAVVRPGGLLALASCSSHIDSLQFTQCNLDGFGRTRRVAKMIADRALPSDHPSPLAMPELKYLKFQLFQLS